VKCVQFYLLPRARGPTFGDIKKNTWYASLADAVIGHCKEWITPCCGNTATEGTWFPYFGLNLYLKKAFVQGQMNPGSWVCRLFWAKCCSRLHLLGTYHSRSSGALNGFFVANDQRKPHKQLHVETAVHVPASVKFLHWHLGWTICHLCECAVKVYQWCHFHHSHETHGKEQEKVPNMDGT